MEHEALLLPKHVLTALASQQLRPQAIVGRMLRRGKAVGMTTNFWVGLQIFGFIFPLRLAIGVVTH